jgi:class 3 adenylate cyclase
VGEYLDEARRALARGDVLLAYDAATSGLDIEPSNIEAKYLAALALARAGSTKRAEQLVHELQREVLQSDKAASPRLHEDTEALEARLAKDQALAARGAQRVHAAQHAAVLYQTTADRHGRYYSSINAATMWLLAGDRHRSAQLASQALSLVHAQPAQDAEDAYWQAVTEAEAALLLGDMPLARRSLERAASCGDDNLANRATTVRQLQLVCDMVGRSDEILSLLRLPTVLHYCGHRIDSADPTRGADSLTTAAQGIYEFLEQRHVGIAYGALASGADIMTAEQLTERGVELHVVLPFGVDQFDQTSVAPAGAEWSLRYRACLAQASSVTCTSDSGFRGDDILFAYASQVAMGHALNRAAFLSAPVEQLAVWDGRPAHGSAGTAHDIAAWRRAGHETHILSIGEPSVTGYSEPPTEASPNRRSIVAILFADFHGFSQLRDEQFPPFVQQVLGPLAEVIDENPTARPWRRTWGDAIQAVFSDVLSAARAAIRLQETVDRIELSQLGLPSDLRLRVGAHAGPVMTLVDPLMDQPGRWGREITRAARIEPRTPEGAVYVTDAFAALLALEPSSGLTTEYVGRVTTAKDFETIPMHHLRWR